MVQDAYSALECNDYYGSFVTLKAHSFNAVPLCLAFCKSLFFCFKISELKYYSPKHAVEAVRKTLYCSCISLKTLYCSCISLYENVLSGMQYMIYKHFAGHYLNDKLLSWKCPAISQSFFRCQLQPMT